MWIYIQFHSNNMLFRYNKISVSGSQAITSHTKHKWCVTEKVHGANFSVYIWPSGCIRCAKRTGFIPDDESFFDHFRVIERYRDSMTALSNYLFTEQECDVVVLFGELFGGAYPDYDSPTSPVQQGVWYSPDLEFMLFDICTNKHHATNFNFLSFQHTIMLGKKYGLCCAEPLLVGTLTEALSYDPHFPSTLPALLGLPPPCDTNIAEGIVIRPYDIEQPFGADGRGMTKVKVAQFSEGTGCPPSAASDMTHLRQWVISLVNPNRIAAAISKVGCPTDRSYWQAIVLAVVVDVAEECGLDDGNVQSGVGADSALQSAYRAVESQIKYQVYNYLSITYSNDVLSGVDP